MTTSEIERTLMEKLKVIEQIASSDGFNDLLYNEPAFQEINNDLPQKHFYLVQGTNVYGHFACELEEGVAHSHVRAPFGGFVVQSKINREDLMFFIIEIERRLKSKGVEEIRIHQAPDNLSNKDLGESLQLLGYKQSLERTYQMIAIEEGPFYSGLHDMEKRKLKKSAELGLKVEWLEETHFKKLFDFIIEQRSLKGFEFSMTWSLLKDFKKALPDRYVGIAVSHEGQMVAGSILIKENEDSIYNFAPAHLIKYNRYSPVVLMTQEIYNWAKENGFKYLNLGTSYLGDESNENLFSFKEKLGAKPFSAYTFQKVLNS